MKIIGCLLLQMKFQQCKNQLIEIITAAALQYVKTIHSISTDTESIKSQSYEIMVL